MHWILQKGGEKMKNQLFRKYRRRIVKEGILKSVFYGLIVGSVALFITAFFSWFFGFRAGLWLAIGLFAVGTVLTACLMYFLKFRPTSKQIAARADALGLEERLITMYELQGDESYMATIQRKDALQAMSKVDAMLIKIVVSVTLIVVLVAALLVGLGGGTVVSSLYYTGAIPSGMELLSGEEAYFTFTCSYTVGSGADSGIIVLWTDDLAASEEAVEDPTAGLTPVEASYSVKEGENAPAVYAVPAYGYAFVGWSDGVTDPYRQDMALRGSINVSANFVQIMPDVEALEQDLYYKNGDGNGNGGPSNFQQPGTGAGNPSNEPGKGDGTGETRRDVLNQQIIDGDKFYGDYFSDSYGDAQDRLGSDSNIPEDMKGWVSDYFGNIGTGSNEEGEGGDSGSGEAGGEANP